MRVVTPVSGLATRRRRSASRTKRGDAAVERTEDIMRLEITMRDAQAVDVGDGS